MKKIAIISFILLFAHSCGVKRSLLQKDVSKVWDGHIVKSFDETAPIEVLVVTNRNQSSSEFSCHQDQFGVKYANKLTYGICDISVPRNHAVGELNFAQELVKSPQDYFKIRNSIPANQTKIITKLKQSRYPALVFVHGFNVDYREAILRAAQIAYDLKYQGPVLLFSWPAGAKEGFLGKEFLNQTYEDNLVNAKSSIKDFRNFLLQLKKHHIEVNVMVHSMGHQVVLPALNEIVELGKKKVVKNLVLNAPDFEVNAFILLSTDLKKVSENTTIYCSYKDKAISVSENFNDGKRIGGCAFPARNVDVINVDLVNDDTLLGHGYYSSRAVLNDVFQGFLGIQTKKRLFIVKDAKAGANQYIMRK